MLVKINKFMIACILLCSLTGCWDYEDIDKKCIVIATGIDRVEDKIQFSGEIAQLKMAAGSQEKAEVSNVYHPIAQGKTFEEARVHYETENPFPVFGGITRVVAFGETFAKEGITPYLNRIGHVYDYRKSILTIISREKPEKLFQYHTPKDVSVGFLIEDMINQLTAQGKTLYPTFVQLLSDIAQGQDNYVLPYIGIEKGGITYLGLAVMKNSKIIDVIDVLDTDGILYILAKKPSLIEELPQPKNPKNIYSFGVDVTKRDIKTHYKDNKVHIDIHLDTQANFRYQYYKESITQKQIQALEEKLNEKIKKDIYTIIKRAQKNFKADIFGLSEYFRAQNPKIYPTIHWQEAFLKAEIKVDIHSQIVNKSMVKMEK